MTRSACVSREICKICYHVNAVGFHVPDRIWEAIIPRKFQRGVVCLSCFTRLGDEKIVAWDDDIQFFPVSAASGQSWSAYYDQRRAV